MDQPRHIDDLADELIQNILSFLLGFDYLSLETSPTSSHDSSTPLKAQSSHVYGEKSELDRFRLVCRRFMRIGTPQKFPRFVLRFSSEGFRRLDEFLSMQLASHVRNFTYMVRPFYQGSGWPTVSETVDTDNLPLVSTHRRRLRDQKCIIEANHDLLFLRRAIGAFTSLQQVKLLRLQDEADEQMLDWIHDHSLEGTTRLDWEPACTRAVTNLGISLLESNCEAIRFVGPQISPEATMKLLQAPSTSLAALGARLTSLDITFSSTMDLSTRMHSLSNVFYDFFMAAKNLTAIHLGFPAHAPLSLPLEQIFHRLQWKRLRTLSIQGWRLSSEEVIALIRRHRRPLRDLRLASIYLRPGGRWRDILVLLHDEMDHLERLDLREIDYASHFDAHDHHHHTPTTINGNGAGSSQTPTLALVVQPTLHSPPRDAVLNVDSLSFAPRGSTRHSFASATLEQLRTFTPEDLGDTGVSVRQDQWLFWKAWVLSSQRSNVHSRV
ncbi:F-box domain protein [Aspergillus saccharolyticus JOP 1030-1]|uniref:F-box domain protein n=1 Tax=Aspergillus saccharolyticus JOP 1030-1 TaxID=1450539 RepID=A0A318ZKF4_9EURO|nr:hypothetical protein BP01DRAFT_213605 [Aspergillus saccharolyticus JOP 1030-1]PYH47337.1 hypothetical protein BP01DRAFT_213605 [Aspergillus saccharolyticus JOP 1030-1]